MNTFFDIKPTCANIESHSLINSVYEFSVVNSFLKANYQHDDSDLYTLIDR